MTQFYKVPNPGISSISVDGIEHKVSADTGYLEVEVMTPGLAKELAQRKLTLFDPNTAVRAGAMLTPEQEQERQALFLDLDKATGNKVDRRKSLAQLREMKAALPAA